MNKQCTRTMRQCKKSRSLGGHTSLANDNRDGMECASVDVLAFPETNYFDSFDGS